MGLKDSYSNYEMTFLAGSVQIIELNMYDYLGEELKFGIIKDIKWKMAKWGENEVIVEKSYLNSEIKWEQEDITVQINTNDTKKIHGLFTHQLSIEDDYGNEFKIDLGKMFIKESI